MTKLHSFHIFLDYDQDQKLIDEQLDKLLSNSDFHLTDSEDDDVKHQYDTFIVEDSNDHRNLNDDWCLLKKHMKKEIQIMITMLVKKKKRDNLYNQSESLKVDLSLSDIKKRLQIKLKTKRKLMWKKDSFDAQLLEAIDENWDCENRVYAPTSTAEDEIIEEFCEEVKRALTENRRHLNLLIGDFNAKIGKKLDFNESAIGNFGCGFINQRGERIIQLWHGNNIYTTPSITTQKHANSHGKKNTGNKAKRSYDINVDKGTHSQTEVKLDGTHRANEQQLMEQNNNGVPTPEKKKISRKTSISMGRRHKKACGKIMA
ncbi:hypothetical protein ILUMI_19902 [Ignelater luminosus]|uniref:Endonuclease/exonuclease/phosphatase domain-containing protein n=1 Tax=Ignelater luminosus TaxID=2038154 RepID=A0A8K0G2S3_IGNLU|nr:hypothetical protein ILUMI_19902 [Ignelater luminosus]